MGRSEGREARCRQGQSKVKARGKQGQGKCVDISGGRALRCLPVGIGDSIFLPIAASLNSATRATCRMSSIVSALSKGRKSTKANFQTVQFNQGGLGGTP